MPITWNARSDNPCGFIRRTNARKADFSRAAFSESTGRTRSANT
jgi:hypothetical protein